MGVNPGRRWTARAGRFAGLHDCAEETGARLVVGNAWITPRQSVVATACERWMSRKISQRAGRHLPDTQCGFRLIHWKRGPAAAEDETLRGGIEMLLAFLAAECRVEFVPIQVIHRKRSSTFARWPTQFAGGDGGERDRRIATPREKRTGRCSFSCRFTKLDWPTVRN